MNAFSRSALSVAGRVLPGGLQDAVVARIARPLREQLLDQLTDEFLEILLRAMSLAFAVSRDYRANINEFAGTLVFCTRVGDVGATVVFHDGKMEVHDEPSAACDCRISFEDPHALRAQLLAANQDILNSIVANTVDVDGNLNYLYRFGYLARELTRRLQLS